MVATWGNSFANGRKLTYIDENLPILANITREVAGTGRFARLEAVWANVPNWKNCACGLPFAECDSVSFSLVARGRYNVSIHCRTHEGDRT